ncbi:MAG TPA: insulinase family protein, partial [Polyangiaceae bacterium]
MRTLLPLFSLALVGSLGFSTPARAAIPTLLGQSKRVVNTDPGRVKQNVPVQFAPRKPGPPPAKIDAPATSDPAVLSLERFGASIQRSVLDNGLKVVLNPDHSAPTVAVSVTYKVGSSNEVVGRTGFAHLFEHMMFQGSKHAKKGEHFMLVSDRGGSLNGTTNSDRTNYYEVLPANELELALWLESDRMRWLAVTPDNFENQRKVVEEEYRLHVSNAAYGRG